MLRDWKLIPAGVSMTCKSLLASGLVWSWAMFPGTGKLWGKCLLCKKFWDDDHAESEKHKRNVVQRGLGGAAASTQSAASST